MSVKIKTFEAIYREAINCTDAVKEMVREAWVAGYRKGLKDGLGDAAATTGVPRVGERPTIDIET